MLRRLLVVGAVSVMSASGMQAQQSSQGIEQEMLRRLAFQPRDLTAQLELIKIYLETNRLTDAERLLTRALDQVREQRAAVAQTPVVTAEPPKPPLGSVPLPVGGIVKEPKLIRKVPPVYPPIAQSAKVQGIVIVEVLIGVDGNVRNANIIRSVPLLDQAALDSVRQWVFTPTVVNGVPVEVVMTVTVNFTLPG